MFPQIPSDLSSLSPEELQALLDECVAAFTAARPAATTPEAVQALVEFGAGVDTIRGEQTKRTAAAAAAGAELDPALAEQLAALDAAFSTTPPADAGEGGDTGAEGGDAGAGDGAGAEAGAGGEGGEPPETMSAEQISALVESSVTAALAQRSPARTRPRIAANATIAEMAARMNPDLHVLPAPAPTPFTITAAADIPNVQLGQSLSRRQLAEAFISRAEHLGKGRGGPDDKVPVASFHLNRGDAMTLSKDDYAGANATKIRDAVEAREEIVAAGGLCAPVNNRYEQVVISQDWRPVMGSLPQFTADRGGLRFNPPPALADVTSGVATITAAADLAGGAGAVKACFAVTCPGIIEVDVEADYVCVEFGNFGARTFPEQVEAWMQLAAAAHARAAETNRLTDIKTGAPAVTAAGLVGAGRELLTRLEQLQSGINSAARRPNDAPVEAIIPQWGLALLRADFTRSFNDDVDLLGINDQEIAALFAARHIMLTLTPDSATGNSQIIAAPATGVIKEFPTHLFAEVFVPGTYLGLDAGRLDLGLVRDSALTMGSGTTPGNRFRMFYENFEALAVVGPAGSRAELDMTLCADGTYGAAKAVTCPIVT